MGKMSTLSMWVSVCRPSTTFDPVLGSVRLGSWAREFGDNKNKDGLPTPPEDPFQPGSSESLR